MRVYLTISENLSSTLTMVYSLFEMIYRDATRAQNNKAFFQYNTSSIQGIPLTEQKFPFPDLNERPNVPTGSYSIRPIRYTGWRTNRPG